MTYTPGGSVAVQVNFGTTSNFSVRTTVTGVPWVTAGSHFTVTPAGSTVDHGVEDAVIEGLTGGVENPIAGTGFDLVVSSPNGSKGLYAFNVIGN